MGFVNKRLAPEPRSQITRGKGGDVVGVIDVGASPDDGENTEQNAGDFEEQPGDLGERFVIRLRPAWQGDVPHFDTRLIEYLDTAIPMVNVDDGHTIARVRQRGRESLQASGGLSRDQHVYAD